MPETVGLSDIQLHAELARVLPSCRWLPNSIVRGPKGVGKTTVADIYARAAAARGERVVY